MSGLDARILLDAWDTGHHQPSGQWALTLLSLAGSAPASAALAELSIGQRDAGLLQLRNALFGPELAASEQCPKCQTSLETTIDGTHLLLPAVQFSADDFHLASDGHSLRFRLPNSHDLAAASGCVTASEAEAVLLERCVLDARRGDEPIAPSALPAATLECLSEYMGRLDPQADIRLRLRCPTCGHDWAVAFDVLSYLWREVNAWAQRLLRDVHALAASYGWSEAAILAMSPSRRHAYLNLVRG